MLFPEPFGPRIQLKLESNTSSVFSPKDLNPFNKDEPDTLVKDVVEFVYKITQS